jgi:serine phosphatase RsbU (regulator of sigma subunit)
MDRRLKKSEAFTQAVLKSESYRITALLGLVGILIAFSIVQFVLLGHLRLFIAQILLGIVVFAFEFRALSVVKRARKNGDSVGTLSWIINLVAETQIPTLLLIILIRNQYMGPYQVLVAPAILLYFFFIALSTLRLRPLLSLLGGITSAAGYVAIVIYVISTYPVESRSDALPLIVYLGYAIAIVIFGGVAAFIGYQIRGYLSAALREAELQRELDKVNHDLDVARSIQQGLLPTQPPKIEDFEIAGWNKPADQTGGDYFDWQLTPSGELAISLADATGHGIGPALISSACRAYSRASLMSNGHGEGVLNRLNALLAADLPSNRFVTYAVVFLDPATAEFNVLSAGHGPILWYRRADDKVDNLEAQGIPLGMISGFPYENGTSGMLCPGDVLALVTDGFSEWENPEGEDFGVARLENVLRETRGLSAEEIISRLRTAVEEFCRGTKQLDDLTAVIIKRKVH